jgi:argininosuccinate lyase
MIIGGGPTQSFLIDKAVEMGLRTIVADPRPVSPSCWKAEKVICASPADPEGLLLAAKDLGVEGLMTTTMDSGVPIIGWVNDQLGLRGVRESAGKTASSKLEAKKAFLANGVPTARHVLVSSANDAPDVLADRLQEAIDSAGIAYPIIAKPARGASSQGVYKINDRSDALHWLPDTCMHAADMGADLLIEEFMVGREVSAEIVVVGDEPIILQLTDKSITPPPACVEVGHLQPSTAWDDPKLIEQMRSVVKCAIAAVGLTDWPCHLEMMVTADGPKVVEINPRISGDTIGSHLTHRSTNQSFLELALRAVLGEIDPEKLKAELNSFRQCVSVRFAEPIAGKHLKGVSVKNTRYIDDIMTYLPYGFKMNEFLSNYDRVAGYITIGPTREAVRSQLDEIFDGLVVETLEDH